MESLQKTTGWGEILNNGKSQGVDPSIVLVSHYYMHLKGVSGEI
jgi:hypothetical protein